MNKSTLSPTPAHVLFKACSDPTRLRILHMLRGGELCVCDIVAVLDVPQPKVSRHLAALKKAELVTARKEGLWIHYSLKKASHSMHAKLLDALNLCEPLDKRLGDDSRKLTRIKLKAGCCG